MTAAELRALIAGAAKGELVISNGFVGSRNVKFAESVDGGDGYRLKTDGDTELWVALFNAKERFAELLAAEEAKAGTITWERDPDYPSDPTDYNAIQHGEVVGWVWKTPLGGWLGNTQLSGGGGSHYPTEAEARAAVEAAVRAGR